MDRGGGEKLVVQEQQRIRKHSYPSPMAAGEGAIERNKIPEARKHRGMKKEGLKGPS